MFYSVTLDKECLRASNANWACKLGFLLLYQQRASFLLMSVLTYSLRKIGIEIKSEIELCACFILSV